MDRSPTKADLDARYNFTCDGCRKRRNKRMSTEMEGRRWCKSCTAVILEKEPGWLARNPTVSFQHLEERQPARLTRLQALLAWKDRRTRQKRGRL